MDGDTNHGDVAAEPAGSGGKATGSIELRNSGTSAASVDLAFTDISGPLAAELHYAAACAGAAGRSWSGSLGELQTGVVVDGALPAGAVVACSLTESMPANADNRWEGASASFDEVFSLVTRAAAPARVVVPGSNAAGGAGSGGLAAGTHRPAGLAFTGTDSYRMFEIAGAALLFGCLLVWVAWVAADHDTRRRSV